MIYETDDQKRTISRWLKLAIQLLPDEVWTISKLTDVDRHVLSKMWRHMAEAFEPYQFHVRRNGLALLVAYLLHAIDIGHAVIPK